jgi:hypothetical protein
MRLNALLATLAVLGGIAGTSVAQAATDLVIDDWNITGGNVINATGTGGSTGPTLRETSGGTSLTRGYLYTTITSITTNAIRLGDSSATHFGIFNNDIDVNGWGYWSWTGGGNLSAYTGIAFDYVADQTGADLILAFFEGTTLIASIHQSDLVGTGGSVVPASIPGVNLSAATAINEIRLYVYSVGGSLTDPTLGTAELNSSTLGLDFSIRNLRLTATNGNIPEPATLALFALGLAGIGAVRRKKLAA